MSRKMIVVGILLAIFAIIIGVGAILYFKAPDSLKQSLKLPGLKSLPIPGLSGCLGTSKTPLVVSWDSEKAVLTYTDTHCQEQQLSPNGLNPGIIVNKNGPGQPVDEDVVLSVHSPYWKLAFCPGDSLEFQYKEDNTTVKMIRNRGPRTCK